LVTEEIMMDKLKPNIEKTTVEEKELSLKERVEHIDEKLNIIAKIDKKTKKPKKIKLKGNIKRQLKKLATKNKVMYIMLCKNRNIEVGTVEVKNGYIVIQGVPRFIGEAYTYLWNGKNPAIIIREWDLEPIGTEDFYNKYPSGLGPADIAKMVYAVMNSDDNLSKKPMNKKVLVIGAIVIIVIMYILLGGTGQ